MSFVCVLICKDCEVLGVGMFEGRRNLKYALCHNSTYKQHIKCKFD